MAHRITVSFEVYVPDNVCENMLSCGKYDTETIERELMEHLGDELDGHEDEFYVDNISIWEDNTHRE